MIRGLEIADEVADLPRSVIRRQVTNGVAVRMAVLYLLLGTGDLLSQPLDTEPLDTEPLDTEPLDTEPLGTEDA